LLTVFLAIAQVLLQQLQGLLPVLVICQQRMVGLLLYQPFCHWVLLLQCIYQMVAALAGCSLQCVWVNGDAV